MLELGSDLALDAVRITLGRLLPGELLQLPLRRSAGDAHLVGMLILQLVQAERAAFRQLAAACHRRGVTQIAAEQPLHLCGVLQVPVGEALAQRAELVDRALLPDAGDDILQQPTLRRMVQHVAGGDGGHACGARDGGQIA